MNFGPDRIDRLCGADDCATMARVGVEMGLKIPSWMNNTRTVREFSKKNLRVDCRRCLQCLVPLPPRARPDRRFCCAPCHTAWWRRHGGVRAFEHRHDAEGIVRALSFHSEFLTGEAIPERRPLRRRRRGKDGRFCCAPIEPAEAIGPRLTWEEYKKLHGLDQPAKKSEPMERPKRRHGVGCRYKPWGKPNNRPARGITRRSQRAPIGPPKRSAWRNCWNEATNWEYVAH